MARKTDLKKKGEKLKSLVDELVSVASVNQETSDSENAVEVKKKKIRLKDFDFNEIDDLKLCMKIQSRLISRMNKLAKQGEGE